MAHLEFFPTGDVIGGIAHIQIKIIQYLASETNS